jgi:hypothetical protein
VRPGVIFADSSRTGTCFRLPAASTGSLRREWHLSLLFQLLATRRPARPGAGGEAEPLGRSVRGCDDDDSLLACRWTLAVTDDLSPALRRLRGRLGGLATAASHDPREMTVAARAAFLARFEQIVDPAGVLPPAERARRAAAERRRYFALLAWRSAMARRRHSRRPAKPWG